MIPSMNGGFMKKCFLISILMILVALMAAAPAFAKPGKGNVKGEVTAIGAGTLTIVTNRGETVVVVVPDGFDLSSVEVGDWLLVKGEAGQDGTIVAERIKQVGEGSDEDGDEKKAKGNGDGDEGKAEGSKDNSAFCAGDKQDKPHPLAAKIAERYGVTEAWVMGYFCEGYGMGAIMLALQTQKINGADPAALLAGRAEGKGWGVIWQELGLIGSQKEGHSPPGWLKKPKHAGPKD